MKRLLEVFKSPKEPSPEELERIEAIAAQYEREEGSFTLDG